MNNRSEPGKNGDRRIDTDDRAHMERRPSPRGGNRSELRKVRGLGSAKDGTHHFWRQRVTAVAVVPLSLWFITALICIMGKSHAEVVEWIQAPHVTTLLLALVVALYYHLKLGLQDVFEDYVHTDWLKLTTRICLNLGSTLGGLLSVVAILKISFGIT